jgi:hypothetical protein
VDGKARLIARLLAIVGAALIVAGFFSDWFDGTAEFAARDFSGFDLARLIRNLDIARAEDEGELRVAAVVMYLMPALAVNAGVLAPSPAHRLISFAATAIAAAYSAILLAGLFVLSATGVTDLGSVLGTPQAGFWACITGAFALVASAVSQTRFWREP